MSEVEEGLFVASYAAVAALTSADLAKKGIGCIINAAGDVCKTPFKVSGQAALFRYKQF